MDRLGFVIEASEAQSMAEASGLSLTQLLPSLVNSAQTLARPPISNFHVAAVGLAPSGRIFVGVNLEFPGLPLHHSIHAEQFLLTNLFLNDETHLHSFAVSAAPCGHCRQFLQELRGAPDIQLLITSDPNREFTALSHFLPHRFGPHNLLSQDSPFLLEQHHNRLTLLTTTHQQYEYEHEHEHEHEHADSSSLPNGVCNGHALDEKLKFVALEAANKSHAPYSDSPSGVALVDCGGNVYKGSYIESAAFNPSLGPLQAALVAYVAGGGGDYDRIVGAVLVEKDEATVKQEQTARLLLHLISPNCQFKTFLCCCSQPSP
ncbi:cytidine deaminase 1-like [Gastrolobium bilobum]|uniref:cytidine deaminase 1-like n=1 Tax=Gastrolobium bilobum TaxID=150636 RepID=UPI002AAF167D|nr:cytidine deaminase 1-like [Gastrolobium bilobum]